MSCGFDFVYMRALEGSFQDSTSEAIHLMKVFNLPGGCIVAGRAVIAARLMLTVAFVAGKRRAEMVRIVRIHQSLVFGGLTGFGILHCAREIQMLGFGGEFFDRAVAFETGIARRASFHRFTVAGRAGYAFLHMERVGRLSGIGHAAGCCEDGRKNYRQSLGHHRSPHLSGSAAAFSPAIMP